MSKAIHEAMVGQALAALKADVTNIKAKRGTEFQNHRRTTHGTPVRWHEGR